MVMCIKKVLSCSH